MIAVEASKLASLSDVTHALALSLARERAVDAELETVLSKRADLERSFLMLSAPASDMLETLSADGEQLSKSVAGVAELASHISGKVRTLDLSQSRIVQTLDKIKIMLDRTDCVNGITSAMNSEDYEAAASYIGTFMELEAKMAPDPSLLNTGCYHGNDEATGQELAQRQIILAAQAKLEEVVARQLDDAMQRRDQSAVQRFSKMYKPLGKPSEGSRRFVEHLQLAVATKARAGYSALSDQLDAGKKVDFSVALSSLFKDLALALEEHEVFLKDSFGPNALLEAASGIQSECDAHGSKLLARFLEARRVARFVADARASSSSGKRAKEGGPASSDHKQIDILLQELAKMCQLSEEYNSFMLGKMRDAAAAGGNGQLTAAREASFRSGQFNVAVREMLGQYMVLEEHYMNETCSLAIRIDEATPGSLTSSLVDDVFFILHKSGSRALASGSAQCSVALLAELNNLVANTLRDALMARLAQGPARLLSAASLLPEDSFGSRLPPGASEHATGLNNMDVCAEYTAKLRSELESALFSGASSRLFSSQQDRERIRSILSDLSKTASDLRQAVIKSLEQMAESALPRMKSVLDEVASISYSLSESEYGAREAEEGWAQRLILSLQGIVGWLQPFLTTGNYESLFHILMDKVLARLEAMIGRKNFSQLGGLLLERDVRTLLSGLQELSTRTVRDKLSRLTQMALLLGLEAVEEVLDYWSGGEGGGGGITWRLSSSEVRAVLLQRTDFSRDLIMSLSLI